jgi:hypothetical protein
MRLTRILAGVALVSALALLGSAETWSQDKQRDKAKPEKKAAAGLPTYWDQLGLTDAQRAEVVKLTREQKDKVDKLREEIRKLDEEYARKRVAVLTDEQRKKADRPVGRPGGEGQGRPQGQRQGQVIPPAHDRHRPVQAAGHVHHPAGPPGPGADVRGPRLRRDRHWILGRPHPVAQGPEARVAIGRANCVRGAGRRDPSGVELGGGVLVRSVGPDREQVAEGPGRRDDQCRHPPAAGGVRGRALVRRGRAKGRATPWTEKWRRKLSAQFGGKPVAPHVAAAIRKAQRKRRVSKHTPETRAKMRAAAAARLARGVVPNGRAWTRAEDELVKTLPTKVAARRTGRTVTAVYKRRRKLRRAAEPPGSAG